MKRKAITILLCAVLLLSVCVPGTLAFQTSDEKSTDEGQEVQTATEAATEAPTVPSEEPTVNPGEETDPAESTPTQTCSATHIEGCAEDCTGEDCTCSCHNSFYDRVMACATLEEMDELFASATEEELASVSEEQWKAIDARAAALEPAPVPPVVLEISDPPVESEIVSPTVNFTNVAPFGAPVVGGK